MELMEKNIGRSTSFHSSPQVSQQFQMIRSASFSTSPSANTNSPSNNSLSPVPEALGDPSRRRRRLTSEETRVLCDEFEKNQKPNSKTRVKLAMQIPGMTARAIQIWFQNKRAKWKQTRRPETIAITSGSASTSSPLQKTTSKSKAITKKRNSNSSTSPHHHHSSSIRRYASEGELDTLKKEDEVQMQQWLDDFSKSVENSGFNSPTTPNSDADAFYPNHFRKYYEDFESHQKEKKPRSNSAPEMSKSDFEIDIGSLSLDVGLPPLEHYAANLMSEGHVNEDGEFLFHNFKNNIPPPPKNAPFSDNLYPNLSVHVQDHNQDPSQRIRKTKSVPNINSMGH